mgnify:CR=1 FL=1
MPAIAQVEITFVHRFPMSEHFILQKLGKSFSIGAHQSKFALIGYARESLGVFLDKQLKSCLTLSDDGVRPVAPEGTTDH